MIIGGVAEKDLPAWPRLTGAGAEALLSLLAGHAPRQPFKLAADLLRYVTGGIEGAELVESNYCSMQNGKRC